MNHYEDFLRLTTTIVMNYEKIQKEFSEISNVLNRVESCSIAYSDVEFIKMQMSNESFKLKILKDVAEETEAIKAGAKEEFFQNVNFLNIIEEILSKKHRGEIVTLVWEAKKALKYIIYEIDRIKNTNNTDKRIAILKGMIAYY